MAATIQSTSASRGAPITSSMLQTATWALSGHPTLLVFCQRQVPFAPNEMGKWNGAAHPFLILMALALQKLHIRHITKQSTSLQKEKHFVGNVSGPYAFSICHPDYQYSPTLYWNKYNCRRGAQHAWRTAFAWNPAKMSSLAAARADNFYYAPDFDPKKHKVGQRPPIAIGFGVCIARALRSCRSGAVRIQLLDGKRLGGIAVFP